MTPLYALQFIAGLALLVIGAELLVRQATRIAKDAGIPPVVVGLTVVAFGTSAPELAISLSSALRGAADLAVGNVVGSNIANVLLILGISATITPMLVAQQLIRADVPIMVGISLLAYALMRDGVLGRWEGALLVALLIPFLIYEVRQARDSEPAVQTEYNESYAQAGSEVRGGLAVRLLVLAAGLVVMVWGARWLVVSASAIARGLGVSELIIGLTIVAIGTSAPELATSIVAALRGQRDIAVGNVVGSNIWNLLFVLGATALIARQPIPVAASAIAFDLPFMCAVALACLPIFFVGSSVSRAEGLLFVGYYVAYAVYLFMVATNHGALPQFSRWMLVFVVPLTLLGLVLSVLAELRRRRAANVALQPGP